MKKLALVLVALPLALSGCQTASTDAAPAADPAPATAANLAPPPGLSSDQRLIWDALTPQSKADALEFIQGGGTFDQFISA